MWVYVVLGTCGHGGDEFLKRGTGGEDNVPRAKQIFRPGDQGMREKVIGGALGEPVCQTGARRLIKDLPAQIAQDALAMPSFGGQTTWYIPKEHQGEVQLPGEIIRDRHRSRRRLRYKAAIRPQGAELHGKATLIRFALTPHDFRTVPV